MIKITFPDGSVREYNEGVTGLQIAESISSRLAQEVLAAFQDALLHGIFVFIGNCKRCVCQIISTPLFYSQLNGVGMAS